MGQSWGNRLVRGELGDGQVHGRQVALLLRDPGRRGAPVLLVFAAMMRYFAPLTTLFLGRGLRTADVAEPAGTPPMSRVEALVADNVGALAVFACGALALQALVSLALASRGWPAGEVLSWSAALVTPVLVEALAYGGIWGLLRDAMPESGPALPCELSVLVVLGIVRALAHVKGSPLVSLLPGGLDEWILSGRAHGGWAALAIALAWNAAGIAGVMGLSGVRALLTRRRQERPASREAAATASPDPQG